MSNTIELTQRDGSIVQIPTDTIVNFDECMVSTADNGRYECTIVMVRSIQVLEVTESKEKIQQLIEEATH